MEKTNKYKKGEILAEMKETKQNNIIILGIVMIVAIFFVYMYNKDIMSDTSVDESYLVGEMSRSGEFERGQAEIERSADLLTRDSLIEGADVISESESLPDKKGIIRRTRILKKAGLKYPYLRIEEEVLDPNQLLTPERALEENLELQKKTKVMVGDHIIVRLKNGADESSLQAVNSKFGAKIRKKLHTKGTNTFLVELPSNEIGAIPQAVERYQKETAAVTYAEPDFIVRADFTIPNDPKWDSLWGLNNEGQTGGLFDADVDAPEAWARSTGSKAVKVAVIDTGVDYTHPDLKGNIWSNPKEIKNGKDDDGNGYIDDINGWDFFDDDKDPMDEHLHGTHVAGTIGAVGNNGEGVTGSAWDVSIVPLRFLDESGNGADSDAVEAVYYAISIGADVMSNSYGCYGCFSQALKDAIDAANTAGILFVAAAGNEGLDTDVYPHYPSSYNSPNVISVAATTDKDNLASFSNSGAISVDLGAPGTRILSTFPVKPTKLMKRFNYPLSYAKISGTSMATPHVSGAVALLKSRYPGATHTEIKKLILDGVDLIPDLGGKTVTGGRLNFDASLRIKEEQYVKIKQYTPDDGVGIGTIGNKDGFINPGEAVGLKVTAWNIGSKPAPGVTATLSLASPDPFVSIEKDQVSFGAIPAGAATAGSGDFLLNIAPGTPTPREVSFKLLFQDSGGNAWTHSFRVSVYTSSTISGRIFLDGALLAGVTVTYEGIATGFKQVISGAMLTNSDGAYSFFPIIDGTWRVRVQKNGFATLHEEFDVPPSKTNLDFFFATMNVNGQVIDAETGDPISRATVAYRAGDITGSVLSESDGSYSITRVLPKSGFLSIHARHLSEGYLIPPSKRISLATNPLTVDFALQKGHYAIFHIAEVRGAHSGASDINEEGQVIGSSFAGGYKGFLWENGTLFNLKGLNYVASINSKKQIVGYEEDKLGTRAILWEDNIATEIAPGPASIAYSINDAGQVVGYYLDTNVQQYKPFLWSSGTGLLDLVLFNRPESPLNDGFALGINNQGQAVGEAHAFGPFHHPALWKDGKIIDLFSSLKLQRSGSARAINNFEQVVGIAGIGFHGDFKPYQGFLWESGTLHAIGTLGGKSSFAYDVNDVGQVVGAVSPPDIGYEREHIAAILEQDGLVLNLSTLLPPDYFQGAEFLRLRSASGINNKGEIVGRGELTSAIDPAGNSGYNRAFLLRPMPLTSTLVAALTLELNVKYSPPDGLSPNQPTITANCNGGSGKYDWVFRRRTPENGPTVLDTHAVKNKRSPYSWKMPQLISSTHFIEVVCTDALDRTLVKKETVTVVIGPRRV